MMQFAHHIDSLGYALWPGVIERDEIGRVRATLPVVPSGGIRNALANSQSLVMLARSPQLRALADVVLGPGARVTRAILFDKTPDANWRVPWHQDTTIAVKDRVETPGFGPWSVKDGVAHVKPPASVLERVLTLRLHLDPCDDSNGPLLVLPGTHREGFLDEARSKALISEGSPVACTAGIGDVVAFRPLLLHSSH